MSGAPKDGGPAFPVAEDHRTADQLPWAAGMTLRDWFAGQVLAEAWRFSRQDNGGDASLGEIASDAAMDAYIVADAMIAERAEREASE